MMYREWRKLTCMMYMQTPFPIHHARYTIPYTSYMLHHSLYMYIIHFTPFPIHHARYTIPYTPKTIHHSLWTNIIHVTLFPIHHTCYTIEYTSYTLHHSPTPYTVHHSLCFWCIGNGVTCMMYREWCKVNDV
jgi:hypothetical protein